MTCIDYSTHTYDMTEELADMWLEVEDERMCEILALSPWERALLEASGCLTPPLTAAQWCAISVAPAQPSAKPKT